MSKPKRKQAKEPYCPVCQQCRRIGCGDNCCECGAPICAEKRAKEKKA